MSRLGHYVYTTSRNKLHWLSNTLIEITYRLYGIDGVAHMLRYLANPIPTLSKYGANIGTGTIIYPGFTIHAADKDFSRLSIGSHARVVRDCLFDLTDSISIEDNAVISFGCKLITHQHVAKSPLAQYGYSSEYAPICVQKGAVLFANVTVLMGVTVGECAVVAAGALVISDIPSWTLVGGIPARPIKAIRTQEYRE